MPKTKICFYDFKICYYLNMPEKIPPLSNKPIGIGSEKRIFAHPNNLERVIAEYRDELTPEEIKGVYYFGKLVEILFPGSYVGPTQAGKDKSSGKGMFIARKVALNETAQQIAAYSVDDEAYLMGEESSLFTAEQRKLIESLDEEVLKDPSVLELGTAMKQAGLPMDSFNSGNFTIGEDGSVKYIDIMQPFVVEDYGVKLRFNTEKLYQNITGIEDEGIREQAAFYLGKTLDQFEKASNEYRGT